jgi:hypothetical protein
MGMTNKHGNPALAATDEVANLVEELLREQGDQIAALWWACDGEPFALGPSYPVDEQRRRERLLARFQDEILAELEHPPQTAAQQRALEHRVYAEFASFARAALDLEDRHLKILLDTGFTDVAVQFARAARAFDPEITGAEMFQAGRNVFAMNGLQLLMGRPIALTPAILAYSLLYPYSDNLLDDPAVSPEAKAAFNRRFGLRLLGQSAAEAWGPAPDPREVKIDALVAMIEAQYLQDRFPQVWASLRAIHRAQVRSVALLRHDASPYEVDVLGISLDKGGTSVVADGYLVAGDLTHEQARFLYGWGAFLQLADDLQDVVEDREAGLATVFAQTARRWPLDGLVYRLLRFGAHVIEGLACFDDPTVEPLKELMATSAVRMVVTAAGQARTLLRGETRRRLEAHSPFRFWFLDRRRKKLLRRQRTMLRAIEAFGDLGGDEGVTIKGTDLAIDPLLVCER